MTDNVTYISPGSTERLEELGEAIEEAINSVVEQYAGTMTVTDIVGVLEIQKVRWAMQALEWEEVH